MADRLGWRTAASRSGTNPDRAVAAAVAAGLAVWPGFELRSVARTPSTQDLVRAGARAGAAPGLCWLASEQTAGRGRQGRVWTAPPGSALLMSLLLRHRDPAGIPIAAGLAVIDALADAAAVEARLKWPNDVLAGGGKVAGILAEVEPLAPPGQGTAVILGIGVNIAVDGFPPGVAARSLHRLTAPATEQPTTLAVLAALLAALGARLASLDQLGLPGLLPAWRARATGLGGPVVAETPSGRVAGIAEDIGDDGALLVRTGPGRVVRLLAADVHIGGIGTRAGDLRDRAGDHRHQAVEGGPTSRVDS